MSTYRGKIYAKSPYFLVESGSANFESTLYITVWTGSSTGSRPSSPDLVLSKTPAEVSGTSVMYEISALIRSKFQHNPYSYEGFMSTLNKDAVWVGITSTGSNVDRDDYWMALDGYTTYKQGVNADDAQYVFQSTDSIYVPYNKPINVPVMAFSAFETNAVVLGVKFCHGSMVLQDTDLSIHYTGSNNYNALRYVQYADTGSLVDNVKCYTTGGGTVKTLYVQRQECAVYTPVKCMFLNRYGVTQIIWFTKATTSSIDVTKSNYNKLLTYVTSGVPTYETTWHQYRDYEVKGREKFVCNTGWVNDDYKAIIRELVLSDQVWISDASGTPIPVNVSTTSVNYKTSLNDNMINYTVEFQSAYNEINNVF